MVNLILSWYGLYKPSSKSMEKTVNIVTVTKHGHLECNINVDINLC